MKRRISRAVVALLAGLAMSQMVAEPVSANLLPGGQVVFTGQIRDDTGQLSYCGGGYSLIGDVLDPTEGAAVTMAALWWTFCALPTAWPLPPGWLGVSAAMLRNGAACSTTPLVDNSSSASSLGVYVGSCFNPPGWQEWETLGGHSIYNDDYNRFDQTWTLSGWQLY